METDRRKYPRFKIDQMIELNVGRENFVHATGKNLSEGGILCEADEPIEPYTQIYLMIGILLEEDGKEYHQLTVEGVVLRVDEEEDGSYSIGVRFTELSEEDKKILHAYISRENADPV